MKDMLDKMKVDKKGKHDMKKDEIDAKMNVLENLRNHMSDMMADKMRGGHEQLQKVSIVAKNPTDLQKGLDKAKEMVNGAAPETDEAGENPLEEAPESQEMEASEEDQEPTTPEEIDEKIAELQAKKLNMGHKKA